MSENPDTPKLPGLEFLDAAAEIGRTLQDRDEIMVVVAAHYATLGLLDDALSTADEIGDAYLRDTAIANIAVNSVTCEPGEDPQSLVESIEDIGVQSLALEQISVKYAEHDLCDQALEIGRQLEPSDSALSRIAPILAEKESLERGGELVHEIDDSQTRTWCLIELGRVAMAANQSAPATDFLRAAESELQSHEPLEYRVEELIAIAAVYRDLNQVDQAREVLDRAFQLCPKIEGSSAAVFGKAIAKPRTLAFLAGAYASCGAYDQADRAAEQIEDPFPFGVASTKQAVALHKDGHDARALELLSNAGELMNSEECSGPLGLQVRDGSIAELALGYGEVGHYQEALQETLLISQLELQLNVLIELGKKAALAGRTESMFAIYEAVDGDYARASFLLAVSEALSKTDKGDLRVRLLMMAIEPTEKLPRPDQKCLTLIKIAAQLNETELAAKANEILSNVLNTTLNIKDGHPQTRILLAMAEEYQRQGREVTFQEKEALEHLVSLAT